MPLKTPRVGIPYFGRGDLYSAHTDASRMSLIDSQMSAIGEILGDGVIQGLSVSSNGSNSVTVSPGMILFDGKVSRLPYEYNVNCNSDGFIYIRKRRDFGGFGLFSDTKNVNVIVLTSVADLGGSASLLESGDVEITWFRPPWCEFVRVYRSISGGAQQLVGNSYSNNLIDHAAPKGQDIEYYISAIQFGNVNVGVGSVGVVTTPPSSDPPPPLSNVYARSIHKAIFVHWDTPVAFNTATVELVLRSAEGELETVEIPADSGFHAFINLQAGMTYFVDVYANSAVGVSSSRKTVSAIPLFSQGPLSPVQPSAVIQLDQDTKLSYISISWSNPITTPENADPDSPGQIDDASNLFVEKTVVKIEEIGNDGFTPIFSGEEFVSQNETDASVVEIKYRAVNGELLTRALQGNTRYVIYLRRLVNGRYSPYSVLGIRTGSIGELQTPVTGSASVRDDASISAVWSPSSNSNTLFYKLNLDSAPIVSRTRIYDETPQDILGIYRSNINVFDFIVFDISSEKLTIRIKSTDQLVNLDNIVFMKAKWEIKFNQNSTIAEIESFFERAVPLFSIAGTVFTINQLFKTISSDSSKSVLDLVDAFEVSPQFGSEDESILPPDDPRDPSFDPNDLNMSLVSYYVYYFGGIKLYAVNDADSATYRDDIVLGNFEEESFGINGEYYLEVAGTSFETSAEFARKARRYRFSVSAVDNHGNQSAVKQFFADSPLAYEIPNPTDPEIVHAEVRGGTVNLIWTPSVSPVKEYRIYRKISTSEFSYIASIEGSSNTYTDIGLPTGANVIYVVKSVNAWDASLMTPDSLNYINMSYSSARIAGADFNTNRIVLTATKNGYNVNLSWTASDEPADGYEIWLKKPNKSFEIVGNVSSETFSFVHSNVLVESDRYMYAVRPVRGELEVNFSSEVNIPADAFVVAGIFFDDDNQIQVNYDVRILTNGTDLVKEPLISRLNSHRHLLLPDGQDRRIDFNDYFDITNFVSLGDGFRFTRILEHPSIPSGASLSVFINDTQYVGQFSYDEYTRTISFSENILPPFGPFENINSIFVRVSDISEVDNSLPNENMLDLFGEQMESGILTNSYIPDREHFGRRKEQCKPLKASTSSLDGFRFFIAQNEYGYSRYLSSGGTTGYFELGPNDPPPSNFESMQLVGYPLGNSAHVIVYDGCELAPDDSMVLATSIGSVLLTKINTSLKWEVFIQCTPPYDMGPPIRIVLSADKSVICFVYPRGIDLYKYVQSDNSPDATRSLSVFANSMGRDLGIKFIRDACAHESGFVLATDLGPMILSIDVNEQPVLNFASLPDTENTECYSCTSKDGIIYLAINNGIFISNDSGDSWSLFASTASPCRHMKIYENRLFALLEDALLRIDLISRNTAEIHVSENARYRRMEIFKDRMVIIGDTGCMISKPVYSLLFSNNIEFIKNKTLPKFSKINRMPRSVFIYKNDICIGGDAFVSRANVLTRIKTLIDFSVDLPVNERSKIPSIFINDQYIDNGTFLEYSLDRNMSECVFVDDQVDGESKIKIARQYTDLQSQNGGWAWRDFAAAVVVSVNGLPINDGSRADKPVDQLLDFVAQDREFSELFSRSSDANVDYSSLRSIVAEMTNNDREITSTPQEVGVHRFTRQNVRRYVSALNTLNYKIYSDEAMSLMGIRSSVVLKSPEFKTNLIANFVANGITASNLDSRSIAYSPYINETCVGSLGTFDIEDNIMLTGRISVTTPRDGTDNPNYSSPFAEGSITRPGTPNPNDSIFIGGWYGRDRCANSECVFELSATPQVPRPSGSLDAFGSNSSSSSSSSIAPPGGGGGIAG